MGSRGPRCATSATCVVKKSHSLSVMCPVFQQRMVANTILPFPTLIAPLSKSVFFVHVNASLPNWAFSVGFFSFNGGLIPHSLPPPGAGTQGTDPCAKNHALSLRFGRLSVCFSKSGHRLRSPPAAYCLAQSSKPFETETQTRISIYIHHKHANNERPIPVWGCF